MFYVEFAMFRTIFFNFSVWLDMSEYFLQPVDESAENIAVPSDKTVIGRGPFLQVTVILCFTINFKFLMTFWERCRACFFY